MYRILFNNIVVYINTLLYSLAGVAIDLHHGVDPTGQVLHIQMYEKL